MEVFTYKVGQRLSELSKLKNIKFSPNPHYKLRNCFIHTTIDKYVYANCINMHISRDIEVFTFEVRQRSSKVVKNMKLSMNPYYE